MRSLSDETVEIVANVAASVVNISNQSGRGTGVIWSAEGYIITCSHVIGRSSSVTIGLADGRSFEAKVLGQDPNYDVAALKAEVTGLKPIEPGNSENLKVGQFVIALANPYGRRAERNLWNHNQLNGTPKRLRGNA